jgi:hypothetical protein
MCLKINSTFLRSFIKYISELSNIYTNIDYIYTVDFAFPVNNIDRENSEKIVS